MFQPIPTLKLGVHAAGAMSQQAKNDQPAVLIVEDDELIRPMISVFLSEAGFSVLEAGNAAEALQLIAERSVDLVFTDINMPGEMQGDRLAEVLLTQHPKIPVLLTSGLRRPSLRQTSHRCFIAKPYSLARVEHQIRQMLH